MTDRTELFTVGDHARLEVSNTSGQIAVVEGDANVIKVEIEGSADNYEVDQIGDTVMVRPERGFLKRMFSSDIRVTVPAGTEVETKSASGDVLVEVEVGALAASVASGDFRARRVNGFANVKSASGDVAIDRIGGALTAVSASGDIRVDRVAGDLAVKTASGDVNVGRVGGNASFKTASGDLRIGRFDSGDLEVHSLSGDVTVGIPPRRTVDFDMQSMSGELRNKLPEGDGSSPEAVIRIRISSISGDVTIRGAD